MSLLDFGLAEEVMALAVVEADGLQLLGSVSTMLIPSLSRSILLGRQLRLVQV